MAQEVPWWKAANIYIPGSPERLVRHWHGTKRQRNVSISSNNPSSCMIIGTCLCLTGLTEIGNNLAAFRAIATPKGYP